MSEQQHQKESLIVKQLKQFSDSIADQYIQQKIDIANVDLIFKNFIESIFTAILFNINNNSDSSLLKSNIDEIEKSILSTFHQYNHVTPGDVKQSLYLYILLNSLNYLLNRLDQDNSSNISYNIIENVYMTILNQMTNQVIEKSQSLIVLISNLLSSTLIKVKSSDSLNKLLSQLQLSLKKLSSTTDHNDQQYLFESQQQQQQQIDSTSVLSHPTILYTLLSSIFEHLNQHQAIKQLIEDIYNQSLLTPLLMSDNIVQRQTLITTFLPTLLQYSSTSQRTSLISTIMKMFSINEHQIKADAFKILSKQYNTFFSAEIDLTYSTEFWQFEMAGFIDLDPLIRKRANYLLKKIIKRSIDNQQSNSSNDKWTEYFRWSTEESDHLQKQWDTFFLINETLDEFTVHLIAPVWRELDQLLLASPNQSATAPAAVVHQKPLHFGWIDILFQRVMLHENPAVIKAMVLEILNAQYISKLPMDFVFSTMIRSISNTILYRGITEDRIHPSIQFFLDTYFQSLSAESQSVFLFRLLNVISKTEYFSAFTLAILGFIARSNQNRLNEKVCFINDSNFNNVLGLIEIIRRMNHIHRPKLYRFTIEMLVSLSIKDGISFNNVCKVFYIIPIQIHNLPECHQSIGNWLLNSGFSSNTWLTDNIKNVISGTSNVSNDDLLKHGDQFVAMKQNCYMISRVLIYTKDNFISLVENIVDGIQFTTTPLSNQTIINLIYLATIVSNSITKQQSNDLKELLKKKNFPNTFYNFITVNDIVSNMTTIVNNYVKLEFGDSIISIVSFITDLVDQSALNTYLDKLSKFKPTRNKSWSTQIEIINIIQYFYGVFGKRNQLFTIDQLNRIINLLVPLSLQRPQDTSDDVGLNASSWGTTLAYFMKIKWKCIRNLLSILEDMNGLKSLENTEEILENVMDAISGSNRFSIKAILNCAQILLVFSKDENGDFDIDKIERIISSAYASANDTHFTSMTAFIQLAFSPILLSHVPSSEDVNHHTILKKYYKLVLNLSESILGLMNLMVLKCCPVWIEKPEVSLYYIDEIYQSVIFGPLRKDDEWESNDKSTQFYDPMVGFSTFVFDMGIESTYENEDDEVKFGVGSIPLKEVFGRAVISTFLKKMGTLSNIKDSNSSYLEFINSLANVLIEVNLTKEFSKKLEHLINTQPHRKRVRIWQTLCLLAPYYVPENLDDIGKKLIDIIYIYNLPSTRRFINIFIINLVIRFQSLVSSHFISLLEQINARGDIVTSIVITVGNMLLYIQDKELCITIFNKILALCSSHHLSVRNAAIAMTSRVIDSNHLKDKLDSSMLLYIKQLDWYIKNNVQTAKSLERHIAHLSLKDDDTLTNSCDFANLFYDIPTMEKLSSSEITAPGVFEFLVDHIIHNSPLTKQLRHFLAMKSKVEQQQQQQEQVNSNDENNENENQDDIESSESKKNVDGDEYIEATQQVGYQKKILPWNDVEDESRYNVMSRTRQQLIIVATFVDKIPNLAGLARTSEIFNVESLVVSKKKVANDPMFQQISVSAERWLPMQEVEEHQLKEYLLGKKQEGYTLLGVEQTSTSSKLNEYRFPEKSVLLLGKEREGIPTEYINLLDKCIEIPQLGIIRSLNVHVSGSILLWEYTKQMINNKK